MMKGVNMRDLSEECKHTESVFLQKNEEVTEELLIKEGNEVGVHYDDLRERM